MSKERTIAQEKPYKAVVVFLAYIGLKSPKIIPESKDSQFISVKEL